MSIIEDVWDILSSFSASFAPDGKTDRQRKALHDGSVLAAKIYARKLKTLKLKSIHRWKRQTDMLKVHEHYQGRIEMFNIRKEHDASSGAAAPADAQITVAQIRAEEQYRRDPTGKASKFVKMLACGVPRGAVELNMLAEGVDPKLLDAAALPESAAPPKPSDAPDHTDVDDGARKYRKMLQMGVPQAAVVARMQADGVDPSLLTAKTQPSSSEPDTSSEDVTRFIKMKQVGVPLVAVRGKMAAAGLTAAQIAVVCDDSPGSTSATASTAAATKPSTKAATPLQSNRSALLDMLKAKSTQKKPRTSSSVGAPTPQTPTTSSDKPCAASTTKSQGPQSASNRRKLHWKKLSPSKVSGTVWESLPSFALSEDARQKLQSLFVKPEQSDMQGSSRSCNRSSSSRSARSLDLSAAQTIAEHGQVEFEDDQAVAKPELIQLLDARRAGNVGIVLQRFSKISWNAIVRALITLNEDGISADDLRQVLELQPTAADKQALEAFEGNIDKLAPAERHLMQVMRYPRFSAQANICMLAIEVNDTVADLAARLDTVRAAADAIATCEALHLVFAATLQLGNFLNAGTEQGEAKGFTMDAFAKLKSVKSYDRKTTGIEAVVKLILLQQQNLDVDHECASLADTPATATASSRVPGVNTPTTTTPPSTPPSKVPSNARMQEHLESWLAPQLQATRSACSKAARCSWTGLLGEIRGLRSKAAMVEAEHERSAPSNAGYAARLEQLAGRVREEGGRLESVATELEATLGSIRRALGVEGGSDAESMFGATAGFLSEVVAAETRAIDAVNRVRRRYRQQAGLHTVRTSRTRKRIASPASNQALISQTAAASHSTSAPMRAVPEQCAVKRQLTKDIRTTSQQPRPQPTFTVHCEATYVGSRSRSTNHTATASGSAAPAPKAAGSAVASFQNSENCPVPAAQKITATQSTSTMESVLGFDSPRKMWKLIEPASGPSKQTSSRLSSRRTNAPAFPSPTHGVMF